MQFTWSKKNKPKQEPRDPDYKRVKNIKVLNTISLCSILAVICLTLWFLYDNMYQALTSSQVLFLANDAAQLEPLNFDLYTKTQKAWKEKTEQPLVTLARDPFLPTTTSTTSTQPVSSQPMTEKQTHTSL
jgi:hypothetical protein